MGWTHLDKFCACLKHSMLGFKTFQMYDQNVGKAVDEVVKKSCNEACAIERKLTIENAADIEKNL
jgi:hypothetical protein